MFLWKKHDPARPRREWPWTLSEGGDVYHSFTWENIRQDLARLDLSENSFLILNQEDPKNSKNYWFVQSAIARKGPKKGMYIVGCGYSGKNGPVMLERCYDDLDDVIGVFERAFRYQPLDLTGYEDCFGL